MGRTIRLLNAMTAHADPTDLHLPALALEAILHVIDPFCHLTIAPTRGGRRELIGGWEAAVLDELINHRSAKPDSALSRQWHPREA